MVSPIGADAAQTATSVRAGIRRMRELPSIYLCRPEDERLEDPDPLVGSAITHLDPAARRAGRVAEWLGVLAGHAFRDLARRGRLDGLDPRQLGLFLAVPEAAGLGPEESAALAIHFHDHAGRDLLPGFATRPGDRTTGLALLQAAAAAVGERRISQAVVGGVESYLFSRRLAPLDDHWRLLCERNPDGFQPGEAAAFVLLERRADALARGLTPLATLRGFGAGAVAGGPGPPNTGAALVAALESLVGAAGPAPLVLCDLNGESSRTREWGFALSRLGSRLGAGATVLHPASALGDVGSASGAVLLALAAHTLGDRRTGRQTALIWAAADDGDRRAALLGEA